MGEVKESYDGFKWYIEEEDHNLGLVEEDSFIINVLKKLGGRDRIFLDVGAYIGKYSIRLSKYYKVIYAFEPNPYAVKVFKRNLELNHIKNVVIIQRALGSRRALGFLHLRGGSSTLLAGFKSQNVARIEIVPLDDLELECHVIKIDVEGYEVEVVRGAYNTIRKYRPIILIEHHEFREYKNIGSTYYKIKELLKDYIPLFLGSPQVLWVPREFDLRAVQEAVYAHWFNFCLQNIKKKKPWYWGVPYTWWWGMSFFEFIHRLPQHLEKEDEWFEKIKRGEVEVYIDI